MFKYNLIKKIILFFFVTYIGSSINFVQAQVITSVKPLGFIAAALTNGVTNTDILLPDGASPHTYSLKPSDLVKIKSADLIIWIGEDMEAFLPNFLKNIDSSKQLELVDDPNIVALLKTGHPHGEESDENDHGHSLDEHRHGQFDMHIWLSPKIAKIAAQIIHDKLVVIYPEKSDLLDKNLSIFIKKLKETEQIIAKKLNNVQNKGYFVFHDGYGYFETEFNLNHLGSFTINPAIQPGVKKIYEIQRELSHKNAVCVFREPQFSPAIVNKLVDGTHVNVGELDPLGMDIELSEDAYCKFLLKITQQFLSCLK